MIEFLHLQPALENSTRAAKRREPFADGKQRDMGSDVLFGEHPRLRSDSPTIVSQIPIMEQWKALVPSEVGVVLSSPESSRIIRSHPESFGVIRSRLELSRVVQSRPESFSGRLRMTVSASG